MSSCDTKFGSCTKLDKKIDIERPSETTDSMGQVIQSFIFVANRFAKIETLAGRELEIARQTNPQISLKVTMRYFEELRSRDRLIFKKRIFNIEYVQNILQENKKIICFCTETIVSIGEQLV